MDHGTRGPRNLRGSVMRASVASIEHDLAEAIPRALRREPAKVIAFSVGVRERTAENWISGANLPNGPALIALARECPEIRAMLLHWLDAFDADGVAPDLSVIRRAP
jgi:hypothetical protein